MDSTRSSIMDTSSVKVLVFETPEKVAEAMAQDILALAIKAVQERGRFTIALSGGHTPKLLFQQLAQEPLRSQMPWEQVWIFWGDERCVPKDHPDSNYRLAEELLLTKVPVRSTHVFRMRGEEPPPQAARDYEDELKRLWPQNPWPAFDLTLLGLGMDGHVASLIPGSPALLEEGNRWVVGNVIRSLQTVRITLTLPSINHSRAVWFLVTGSKKKEILSRILSESDASYPASLVRPETGELRWYIDQSAAS